MSDILYLGDTSLATAAPYLAGVLQHQGWRFDYVPSDECVTSTLLDRDYRAYVLSDYMASRFPVDLQSRLVNRVSQGAGLLMIGGWESFHGLGGDWDGTPIADILPVEISSEDDRVNCDYPVFVCPTSDLHPILRELPWNSRPPLIGGYNRFRSRPGATTLLEAVSFAARCEGKTVTLTPQGVDPLLVVSAHVSGRVAALATDVAPHWVGPWVDWGTLRVKAHGPGACEIEVGNLYAQFFQQLVGWTAGW